MRIHIGVFAHNEGDRIASVLADLARQDVFDHEEPDVRVFVLANGCTDDTVAAANAAIAAMPGKAAARSAVLDLPFKGKSRTWNHFVHELCVGRAGCICCVDGDIRIPDATHLRRMLQRLQTTRAQVVASRPRKDIEVAPGALSWLERLIVLASGTASDYRSSIAGSLYLVRTDAVAGIHMPVGLPVEDGFLRAMILTRLLTESEEFGRIHGEPEIWHVYESLRSIPALVRHQTRLVVGSAVNTIVFDHLCANASADVAQRSALLREAASDEQWLARVLRARLPKWPGGFVPLHFLVKRLQSLRDHGRRGERRGAARALLVATLGLGFDFVVYANAQLQMARGKGAGYW
jgi:hypothetical protein